MIPLKDGLSPQSVNVDLLEVAVVVTVVIQANVPREKISNAGNDSQLIKEPLK